MDKKSKLLCDRTEGTLSHGDIVDFIFNVKMLLLVDARNSIVTSKGNDRIKCTCFFWQSVSTKICTNLNLPILTIVNVYSMHRGVKSLAGVIKKTYA